MTVYEKIDKARDERGLSRRKLAQLAGIPPSTLQSMMERRRGLTVEAISKIATALGTSPEELLNGDSLGAVWSELVAIEASEQMRKNGYTEYNPLENEDFSEIHIPMNADPRLKKSWRRLMEAFFCLNLDGQEVAADRVEELAQIPKYQSERVHSGHMENPPGDADDKEPDKK